MVRKMVLSLLAALACFASTARAQPDFNEQLEEAMKAAVRKAAPSVVRIDTEGGADMVVTTPKGPVFRKALGPTTGVIVSADGYIISSAFNFLNSPKDIFVNVPGHAKPFTAKKIATDRNRMLTLIKIEAAGLPVPAAVPTKDIREGQWSIALGRTLNTKPDAPPSISVGVISALGRIWGKAVQTDAKVSPVNYGGPIIDLRGRTQGILIPASPQMKDDGSIDETAGFEWYDSGIGFAIPFADILATLDRLKQGKDLKSVAIKGLIGPASPGDDMLTGAVVVKQVAKDSAGARAGLKVGDVITEVDGLATQRLAEFRKVMGRKYDGDKVVLKIKRGAEVLVLNNVELTGAVPIVSHPFLGILPMRDDNRLGVEIRFVYPKSPADRVGLKEGDRIVKYGTPKNIKAFEGPKFSRDEFTDFLNTLSPGSDIQLEVLRKAGKKTETLDVKLESLTQELAIPERLEKATLEKAREPLENSKQPKVEKKGEGEKGLVKRATPTGEHKFWVFVPDNYDPDVSYSLIVWLHLPGVKEEKDREKEFVEFSDKWERLCETRNMIMVFPVCDNDSGWVPGDSGFIIEAVRDVMDHYTIDRQRVVAHGMAIGGQMAMHLGFNHRDVFHGVVSLGAVASHPRESVKENRLSFFMAAGKLDPLVEFIGKSGTRLVEMGFPVVYRTMAGRGREYFPVRDLTDVANWIDTLDKQ